MNDEAKTKKQLVDELRELRERNIELERSEAECERTQEGLAETNTLLRNILEYFSRSLGNVFETQVLDIFQAQEALRETNIFLRNILESSSSIAIISTDLERSILYWNAGAENIFGYKAEEVVGQRKIDILYADQDSKKRMEEVRSSIFINRKGRSCEIRKITKDERTLWINMTMTPRFDENGHVIGILGIGEDITERKRAEEGLQHSLESLQKSLEGIIHILVLTIETRDPYTAGHQRRVADLAVAIAKEMGLPETQIGGIYVAGTIHDLGKISIPAEILSKPGRLTEIQFGMIRTHPQVGYEILRSVDFPWPIAQIMLQHHERINGSGYPSGLSGGDLLLEAKILAVADVVEATASHRPYRAALGIDEALKEASENRGVLYEPEVVDACLRLFTHNEFKFDQENEPLGWETLPAIRI